MKPFVTAPTVQTQMAYRPNYITQQVAKTSYVPQVNQVQVPIQVQRMQTEMVTQNVPVQTTRMVPTTVVRKVPYVVQRPVTETLTRKVPVQQQRWVSEERVRKVPVQTTRMTYETRREPIQVQYYEQEAVTRTVMKPVTRQRCIPYNETIMVPKQVVQRVPLSYYDPFSPAIVNTSYSSFSAPVTSSVVSQPIETSGSSILTPGSFSDEPQTRVQRVEIGEPESAANVDESDVDPEDSDAEDADAGDSDPVEQPKLNGPDTGDSDEGAAQESSTDATNAGWRIRWNPVFAREV